MTKLLLGFVSLSLMCSTALADVCSDTKKILSQGHDTANGGMSAWKSGNYGGDPDYYIPSFSLPNGENCQMYLTPGLQTYRCDWSFVDEASAKDARTKIVNGLRSCDVLKTYGFKEDRVPMKRGPGESYTDDFDYINVTPEQRDDDHTSYDEMMVKFWHADNKNILTMEVTVLTMSDAN